MTTETIEKIPDWAATYIMYGDDTALEGDDRAVCDAYLAKLEKERYRLVSPVDGTESEFEPYPAFGLACSTQDWTAEVLEAN